MQSAVFLAVPAIFLFVTWGAIPEAVSYALTFGVISLVFCLAAIILNEETEGKPTGSIRGSMRKYILSIIFGPSLAWVGDRVLGLNIIICYVIAGAVGFTIHLLAPWLQYTLFGWVKKVFKSWKA